MLGNQISVRIVDIARVVVTAVFFLADRTADKPAAIFARSGGEHLLRRAASRFRIFGEARRLIRQAEHFRQDHQLRTIADSAVDLCTRNAQIFRLVLAGQPAGSVPNDIP